MNGDRCRRTMEKKKTQRKNTVEDENGTEVEAKKSPIVKVNVADAAI